MGTLRFFAAVLIAAVIGTMTGSAGAQAPHITPPLSRPQAQYYQQHPQELQQLLNGLSQAAQQFTPARPLAPGETPAAGGWTSLNNSPGTSVQNPLLMTDGTVIAMAPCTGQWYKLTPDITGSYINGTWTAIAQMPSGYGPLFGGSGVLPDGRVIFEGGEYNDSTQSGDCGNAVWTSLGAIYDPVADTWTNVNPPSFWTQSIFGSPGIGDAAGIVLDNGIYMQSACCFNVSSSNPSGVSALFNPSTLTWTTTGSGKRDPWDEEGMAKLQNGNLLVVDANIAVACNNAAEIYNASTGTFSATGSTVDQQADCSNPAASLSFELGPLVTRQDGSAVIFPGVLCSDAANSNCSTQASGFVVVPKIDVYNVGAGTWSTLATMPRLGTAPNNYYYDMADAPAAVLPDGNVLIAVSPNYQAFVSPTHYFELSLSSGTLTQVGDTADAASAGAYEQNFLLLPTGNVLGVSQSGNIQIYTPLAGSPHASWAPVITEAPGCVSPGKTYLVSGTQLNGLTEGSYYGDDVQAGVNFPVVRVVNNSTGHVFYAKTFNHSTRSIAPNAAVHTNFTVASGTELGASKLYDVAAGIASTGTAITVKTSCLADTHDFNADGKSDILWRDGTNLAVWLMNGAAVLSSGGVGGLPSTWSVVGQRDFNGDGKADLLLRDTSGNIAMWFMNGTAVSSAAGVGNLPTNWAVAGIADFNGDGLGDILWTDGSGNYAVWLMNGASVMSSAGLGNLPVATWTVAGTGDFNGDGRADILWRDSSGDIAIWFMNGVTVASSAGVGNLATTWSVVGTGDFNGDGKSDIAWRDTAGDVAIWLMNGAAVAAGGGLGTIPTTVSIVQTGDYNGDGMSDLLWHDTSGNTSIWFMNGVTVSSAGVVGNISTVWTIQSTNSD
jgi:FG-GAP-like repeat